MNPYRNLARSAAAIGLALVSLASVAQGYPEKSIALVVPFGPGSFPDTVARVLGQKMSENMGQPVVIDNRVGAGGNIATEFVVHAKPDGYTLLLHTVANAINQTLYRKLNFDANRDLVPVSQIAAVGNVLVVSPALGVSTLPEFLDLAKKRKPGLSFASGGNGTTSHLAGQLLKTMTQIDVIHVPYKNFGQALTDVMGGAPDFVIPNIPPTAPQVTAGKLKAIAVTSAKRSPLLPGTPTFAEAGLPGYEVTSWNGIAVPKGTPAEVIARLHREVVKALKDPEVAGKLSAQGAEIVGSSPAEYAAFVAAETAKWKSVVIEAGAQVD